MTTAGRRQIERHIAWCRVVLSVAAIVVVYVDSETPLLARWIPFLSGPFTIDPRILGVMAVFLAYSIAIYWAVGRRLPAAAAAATPWLDVLFGAVIAAMTAGVTGPSFPFLAFAVVASALRGGLRQAMLVTASSVALYAVVAAFAAGGADAFVMRPVYLGVTAYLVSYLGRHCFDLQERAALLEVTEQRHRIARDLHDGYAQALSGINLRLEAARRLLAADRPTDALRELTELQRGVNHEHDELRRYLRSLAGVEVTAMPAGDDAATRVRIHIDTSGRVDMIDHVLGVVRAAVSNIRRHAGASTAAIEIHDGESETHIGIDDDGVGLPHDVLPWTIASRVQEVGGDLRLVSGPEPGAHILITIPRS